MSDNDTETPDPYAIPENDEFMPCHVRGNAPEGYDADDAEGTCCDCADKFTCLPEAVESPKVWTDRGATPWAIEDDSEVAAVVHREMFYSDAIDCMTRRMALRKSGDLIPVELLTRRPAEEDIPAPATPPETTTESEPPESDATESDAGEEDTGEQSEQSAEEDEMAKKKKAPRRPKGKKKASKKKAPRRPKGKKKASKKKAPAKKAAKKPAKAKKKAPKKPKPKAKKKPASRKPPKPAPVKPRKPSTRKPRIAKNGKKLPLPSSLTTERMLEVVGQIKLGMKVDFEIGMQIVRRARSGKEHVVTLKDNGFLYEDELYSSLSAAAQNASGTPCRSGNDWFSLMNTSCTEVRDASGKVIARKGMDL